MVFPHFLGLLTFLWKALAGLVADGLTDVAQDTRLRVTGDDPRVTPDEVSALLA